MDPSDVVISLILYSWIAGTIAVALVASRRNNDGLAWVAISLLLSPLFAVLLLIAMPHGKTQNNFKDDVLREERAKSPMANAEATPPVEKNAERSGAPKPKQPIPVAVKVFWVATILFSLLVAIVAIISFRY